MRNQWIWVLILSLFLGITCAKKEKQGISTRSETRSIEIDTPGPRWEKTFLIAAADTGVISRVMAESMARRMSRPQIRILSRDSESAADADYVIYTKAVQQNHQLTLSYILKDNQQDIISQDTISLDTEMMLTAVETMSMQAVSSTGDTIVRNIPEHSVPAGAFSDFLKAESLRFQGTPEALNQAVRTYKTILRTDSLFTEAWTGLAECYLSLIEQGYERNPVWLSLAQHTGFKLKQICSGCGDGEAVLGRVAMIRGDFQGAEDDFRQALEKNPNLLPAWRGLGQIFGRYGLYNAANEMYDHALNIHPADLTSGVSKAMILGGLGEHQQAVLLLNRLIGAHPGALYLHSILALQLYYQGNNQSAMSAIHTGLADPDYQPLSHAIKAMILIRTGDRDEALGELELEVKSYAEGNGALATAVAAVYSLLGRPGESIQWLRSAVNWGYMEYPWLINDPNFSNLAGDARFQTVCDTLKILYDQRLQTYLRGRNIASSEN